MNSQIQKTETLETCVPVCTKESLPTFEWFDVICNEKTLLNLNCIHDFFEFLVNSIE